MMLGELAGLQAREHMDAVSDPCPPDRAGADLDRRGLPASVALSGLAGQFRCPNRPSGERGAAPGSRSQAGPGASTAGLPPGAPPCIGGHEVRG